MMPPGSTALTLTVGPSSTASVRVMALMAPFDAS
jgi:hypothetical protein